MERETMTDTEILNEVEKIMAELKDLAQWRAWIEADKIAYKLDFWLGYNRRKK